MKPNHETIYLVPTDYDGGQLTYSWCDCPAPGEGMDPEDAIKYVRADSIAELTRKNLELQARVNEQSKVIEHIAKAVGEEADPMACWEAVDALKAQVEQLREFALSVNRKCADYIMDGKRIDFEALGVAAYDSYRVSPAQCLAEIKAQAVEEYCASFESMCVNQLDGDDVTQEMADGWKAGIMDCRIAGRKYANQLRQQAKGE